jgi:hypothetical protein
MDENGDRQAHRLYDAEGKPTRDQPWLFRT